MSRSAAGVWTDCGLALIVFLTGAGASAQYMHCVGETFFYQTQMASIVMSACGRGFAQPATLPVPLLDFLFVRSPTFDCAALAAVTDTLPAGPMANDHLYLALVVAALWRWFGVAYHALWPLMALLHGGYAVGGFVLGRLFFGRWTSLLIGIALATSPAAISMLSLLRDYSKAPFIIWSMVLLVLAIRERRALQLIALSIGLGVLVGIGTGFRGDVMIMFPIGVLLIAIGQRGVPFRIRLTASTVFAVTALLAAAPLGGGGISVAHGDGAHLMQGATEPFRAHLGLSPTSYDFGTSYSDELTLGSIAADLRRIAPLEYDAAESKPFAGITQAQTRSDSYVVRWLPLFSADLATRALASAIWIAGFPALLAPERREQDPYRPIYPAQTSLAQFTAALIAVAAQPWMPIIGAMGLITFIWRIFARSQREACCIAIMLCALLVTPSIQFGFRHLFHLEIFFWLGIFSLFAVLFEFSTVRSAAPAYAGWLCGMGGVVAVIYAALILIQDHALTSEIRQLIDSPRQAVPTSSTKLPSGRALLRVAVPDQYRNLVEGPPDSFSIPTVETVPPFMVREAADRLIVQVGGIHCDLDVVELVLSYRKRAGIWQPLDRSVIIPRSQAAPTVLVTPVFYRPTQYFEGIELRDGDQKCIMNVGRLHDASRLPVVMTLILPPDWEREGLHLGIGGF
jgi:hypothetical protein